MAMRNPYGGSPSEAQAGNEILQMLQELQALQGGQAPPVTQALPVAAPLPPPLPPPNINLRNLSPGTEELVQTPGIEAILAELTKEAQAGIEDPTTLRGGLGSLAPPPLPIGSEEEFVDIQLPGIEPRLQSPYPEEEGGFLAGLGGALRDPNIQRFLGTALSALVGGGGYRGGQNVQQFQGAFEPEIRRRQQVELMERKEEEARREQVIQQRRTESDAYKKAYKDSIDKLTRAALNKGVNVAILESLIEGEKVITQRDRERILDLHQQFATAQQDKTAYIITDPSLPNFGDLIFDLPEGLTPNQYRSGPLEEMIKEYRLEQDKAEREELRGKDTLEGKLPEFFRRNPGGDGTVYEDWVADVTTNDPNLIPFLKTLSEETYNEHRDSYYKPKYMQEVEDRSKTISDLENSIEVDRVQLDAKTKEVESEKKQIKKYHPLLELTDELEIPEAVVQARIENFLTTNTTANQDWYKSQEYVRYLRDFREIEKLNAAIDFDKNLTQLSEQSLADERKGLIALKLEQALKNIGGDPLTEVEGRTLLEEIVEAGRQGDLQTLKGGKPISFKDAVITMIPETGEIFRW